MGATFSRIKSWTVDNENLTDEELNAEFNNILDNLTPAGVDDYSASLAQMKIQTSPGAQGSESLATSLAGEIARLRYVLNRLIGGTYWYDAPPVSLTEANTLISLGNTIPTSRIVSGKSRSASDAFPIFLQPHGTNATVTLKAAVTPFVYYVNGVAYTVSSDVTATGLSLAPATNNTCLVDDVTLTGSLAASKFAGELNSNWPTLTVDTMGTEITALVGKFAAFKTSTEYFVAFVKSTTELTQIRRGYFFDSTDTPLTRVAINNNDTITLCKMTWVFVTTAGAITTTQNPPIWAYDQPTSPGNGDYWYDLDNNTWKLFNGSSYISAAATFIGSCVLDTVGCKAARSNEFFAVYSPINSIVVEKLNVAALRSAERTNTINVAGNIYRWERDFINWEMAVDLASGLVEAASTIYYVYLTENGDTILDVERPYDRNADLFGYYHPYHNWRCVGESTNDSGSDLGTATNYGEVPISKLPTKTILLSSSSGGAHAETSTTFATVTNLTKEITVTGRPVFIGLNSDGSGNNARFYNADTDAASFGYVKILRNSTEIARFEIGHSSTGSSDSVIAIPVSAISHWDVPAKGTYTYTVQSAVENDANTSLQMRYTKLVVFEI